MEGLRRSILVAMAVCSCLTNSSNAQTATIFGINRSTTELYSISTANAAISVRGTTGIPSANSLMLGPDGRLYALSSELGGLLYRIDPATAQATQVGFLNMGPTVSFVGGVGLTLDSNGTAWGAYAFVNPDYHLFTVDLTTGAGTLGPALSGLPSIIVSDLAWRSDGKLIGVEWTSSPNRLVTIDPSTGSTAVLAPLLPATGAISGMTISGGLGYFSTGLQNWGSNELWSFNPATGTHNFIGSFSGTVTGFGISGLAVDPGPTFVPYCFGDSTGAACPCDPGQAGSLGQGCKHSFGTGGRLSATGTPSIASDTVVLHTSNLPPSTFALFFQGTTVQAGGLGATSGDGLLCVNGAITRMGILPQSAGASSLGFGHGALISQLGHVPGSGGARHYQVWFRNNQNFCTPSNFNLTNGLTVNWTP